MDNLEIEVDPKSEPITTKVKKKQKKLFFCITFIILLFTIIILFCGIGIGVTFYFLFSKGILHNGKFDIIGEIDINRRRGSGIVDKIYVVNANPENGEVWRKINDVDNSGKFTLEIEKNEPWIVMFLDSSKIGDDMIQGIFESGELSSIYAKKNAEKGTNLGVLQINDTDKMAKPEKEKYSGFIKDLDLTNSEANLLGKLSKLMLRYTNPDINGDGIIDMLQPEYPEFSVSVSSSYVYGPFEANYTTDYVRKGLWVPTDDIDLLYTNSGVELTIVNIPDDAPASIKNLPNKWSVEWSDKGSILTYGINETNQETNTIRGVGAWSFADNWEGGPGYALIFTLTGREGTNIPEGTYTYKLYTNDYDTTPAETLTFTNVETPDDTNNVDGYVFPFFKLNTDSGDVSEIVTSFDYQWKKYEFANKKFVDATAGDLEVMIGKSSAQIAWCDRSCFDSGMKCVSMNMKPSQINDGSPSGTIHYNSGLWSDSVGDPVTSTSQLFPLQDVYSTTASFTAINGQTFQFSIENMDGDLHEDYWKM